MSVLVDMNGLEDVVDLGDDPVGSMNEMLTGPQDSSVGFGGISVLSHHSVHFGDFTVISGGSMMDNGVEVVDKLVMLDESLHIISVHFDMTF